MTKPIVAAESLVALRATDRRLDEYPNYEINLAPFVFRGRSSQRAAS